MLDLIISAKEQKLGLQIIAEIESILEYSLGEIAEEHFKKNPTDWNTSYCYAASILAPDDDIFKQLKNSYPPILDIHSSVKLENLTAKHFLPLMFEKDPKAVVQAFINIERWNYGKPKSAKAREILTELLQNYNKSEQYCLTCKSVNNIENSICQKCQTPAIDKYCSSEIVVPPTPKELGVEEDGDTFSIDMAKIRAAAKKRSIKANEIVLCKCPKCGLEIESTGRSCETIECPNCRGVYLQMKE